MTSWTLLNVVAWSLGLKAVYDLRSEQAPNALTWCFLSWALWFCLAKVAMAAAAIVPALWRCRSQPELCLLS